MLNKKTSFLLIVCIIGIVIQISAQKKYALLIGIDEYIPEGKNAVKNFRLGNLDGCINDVTAINQILITKFGFKDYEIITLLNSNARRDSIINNINLIKNKANKGDAIFIFYAGHGSQVKNSLSSEADKKDETIVPADAYLGIPDIRDKEIAVLLDNIVNKGITLTAIFDCCHSGSMARGLFDNKQDKLRWCTPDLEHDSKDGSISPKPEEKGALIISAAQDDEPASEFRMDNKTPHGAFTFALIQTMNSLPASASAEQIFISIRSILKYNNKKQEPVIAGVDSRLKSNLLGIPNANFPKQPLIALIDPVSNDEIIIQAGYVSGIDVGYQLMYKSNNDSVLIEITEIQSASKSIAKLISGNIKLLKAGDMFEVKAIKVDSKSALKIYLPEALNFDELKQDVNDFIANIVKNEGIELIFNPNITSPTHTLSYQKENWVLYDSEGKENIIGKKLSVEKIIKITNSKAKLFFSIPIFTELRNEIIKNYSGDARIKFTNSISEADYIFNGRWNNNSIEYGFICPVIQDKNSDNDLILPSCTDYFTIPSEVELNNGLKNIYELITKLARLKKWLTLQPPADDGSFPFYLSLRNKADSSYVSNKTKLGQKYELLLKLDESELDNYDGQKRYVHIFVIDATGQMQAIYPLSGVENKYPRFDDNGKIIKEYRIISSLIVGEPLGYDTFFMIVSDEPIPNFKMSVSQTGVQTRGVDNGGLSNLFNEQTNTRGVSYAGSSWYLKKLTVKSEKGKN